MYIIYTYLQTILKKPPELYIFYYRLWRTVSYFLRNPKLIFFNKLQYVTLKYLAEHNIFIAKNSIRIEDSTLHYYS